MVKISPNLYQVILHFDPKIHITTNLKIAIYEIGKYSNVIRRIKQTLSGSLATKMKLQKYTTQHSFSIIKGFH